MNLLTQIGHFFLSTWLWSLSWGMYQAPIAALYMFFALKLRYRMTMVQAVLISLGANIYSFAAYTILVTSILITAVGFEYIPREASLEMPLNDAVMCASLAVIYSLLQTLLFGVFHTQSKLNILQTIVICTLCNGLAAWSIYTFLPVYR